MAAKLGRNATSRVTSAIVGVTLAGVGALIYFSPVARNWGAPPDKVEYKNQLMPRTPYVPKSKSHAPVKAPKVTVTKVKVLPAKTQQKVVTVTVPQKIYSYDAVYQRDSVPNCARFRWQQDAQSAYLANLSDPGGLDGPAGAHNGDGIACSELPVDRSRPVSNAVDPFSWPTPNPPTKAQLVTPAQKYFGLAADGLPTDPTLFDTLDLAAGKAPSMVEWFENFDSSYPFTKVTAAWQRNALPVITWMSTGAAAGEFPLSGIAGGSYDSYLRAFAAGIAVQKLPVVIRFDHEMNGNWYPWSAGTTGNSPSLYIAAWRHVWDIFDSVGANQYAIWAYTPSRVDSLNADGSGGGGFTTIAQDYPGSNYVDWVGMSGYQYQPSEAATYQQTFGKTFAELETLSGNKPIYVAETGSAQSVPGADQASRKVEWTAQTLSGLANDRRVVGFTWFDNNVNGVHYVNGKPIRTDWRFTSSAQSQAAFRAGVADTRYAAGAMPPYLSGS
ncbi:glycoside hydrolase family 26 protein [Jatrophihabitans sp. DSM 45814]